MIGRKPTLTAAQARYCRIIRRIRDRVPSVYALAARFNVSPSVIRDAEHDRVKHHRRRTWAQ